MKPSFLLQSGLAVMACLCVRSAIAQDANLKRAAVPAVSIQEQTRSVIQEVFQEQYRNPTRDGREQLAKSLIEQARSTNNTDEAYVLLQEAIQASIQAGVTETALEAFQRVTSRFEVDEISLSVNLIGQLSQTVNSPDDSRKLIVRGGTYITAALREDDYAAGQEIAKSLVVCARQGNVPYLAMRADALLQEVKRLSRLYSRLSASRKKLEKSPRDGEANLAVGKFYCCEKGNFDVGLKHLVRGTDERLKSLASREQNLDLDQAESGPILKLADDWWDYGESTESPATLFHAAQLYELRMENADGLKKKQIEHRIDQARNLLVTEYSPVEKMLINQWRLKWKSGRVWSMIRFSPSGTMEFVLDKKRQVRKFEADATVLRMLATEQPRWVEFRFADNGTLQARLVEAESGKELDTGTATTVSR